MIRDWTAVLTCEAHRGETCSGVHRLAVFAGWSPLGDEDWPQLKGFPFQAEHVRASDKRKARDAFLLWHQHGLPAETLTTPARRRLYAGSNFSDPYQDAEA